MLEAARWGVADTLRAMAARLTTERRGETAPRVSTSSRTMAGVAVTPDTAVTIAAVWACLRYLSQTVGVLPWHAMKSGAKGAQIQDRNTVDWLLSKRPNPEWSSFQFRETLTHWALRWGNGYAEIERDQAGRPFALWPLHPERCALCRDPETGELYGDIDGGKVEIPYRDLFHIRGFGEGVVGVNVINYASQSLGWAKAAQLFGAQFFGNGANPSGVVINKKGLSPAGLKRQKAEFDELYKGIGKAHTTVHVDNDADYKRIGLNAEETQLLELHQYLVEEVCRWFGVPPHKVMHLLRATFSNIEHQAIEVVIDSVSPWVKRFEDEADYKLFGVNNRQKLYTKMNMRALMRGDSKTRGEYYKLMREVGAYSANRILELEDENTIGNAGDKHTMQQSYTTLEKIGTEAPKPAVPAAPPAADPADDLPDDADAHAMVDQLVAMLEAA